MTNASKVSVQILLAVSLAVALSFGAFATITHADDEGTWASDGSGTWASEGDGTWGSEGDGTWTSDYGTWASDGDGTWASDGDGTWASDYGTWASDGDGTWASDGDGTWASDSDGWDNFASDNDYGFDGDMDNYGDDDNDGDYGCDYECYESDGVRYSQDQGFDRGFGGQSASSPRMSASAAAAPIRVTSPSFASAPASRSVSYPPISVPAPRPTPVPSFFPSFPSSNNTVVTNNTCTGGSCNETIVDNSINGSFNDNSVNGSFNTVVADVAPIRSLPMTPHFPVQYVFPRPMVTGPIAQSPYVSLSQIPYTGFDLGPAGNAIYWGGLATFAGAMAYLLLYYKGGAGVFIPSILGSTRSTSSRQARSPQAAKSASSGLPIPSMFSSEAQTGAPVAKLENLPVKETRHYSAPETPRDAMTIAHDEDGSPRLVVSRG